MRRVVAVAFFLGVAGCTSGTQTNATPSAVASPSASGSATPADHVLMLVTDECTGLASANDCTNARVACAKAIELMDAAKVPPDDKWRTAVTVAAGRCQ